MKYWAAFAVMDIAVILSMYFIKRIKINFKDKNIYLKAIFGLILFVLNFEITPEAFRIVGNVLIYIFLACFLLKINLKESFILGLLIYFFTLISEILYFLLSFSIVNQELFIAEDVLFVFVQNIFVGIILVLISSFSGIKKWYYKLLKAFTKIKSKQVIIFSLLSVVLFNFFIWITYFASKSLYDNDLFTLAGSAISIFSAIFFYVYLKTNNSYIDVSEKYDLSLKSIEEYEKMIDVSKMNNHETRNQFMTIRNMSKNKQITSYIDTLLDNKINDSEQLLNEVSRLPRGGIRGLIYSKLLVMKERDINYNLLIDRKVSINKFNKLDDKVIVDVCKILGVFLDNAIEAVEKLKEKDIVIEIYTDRNDINFAITNNFSGKIEVNELDTFKYTTKGSGRGYGLVLVNDIVKKSNILENSIEIYEDNFTQNIKIKM